MRPALAVGLVLAAALAALASMTMLRPGPRGAEAAVTPLAGDPSEAGIGSEIELETEERTASSARTDRSRHSSSAAPLAEGSARGEKPVPSPVLPPGVDDPVGCVVHGRVTGPDGVALSGLGAAVRFERPGGESILGVADERGAYVVVGLAAGEWIVQSSARGYRPRSFTLAVGPEPVARRDVVLEPAVVLRVALDAPDGRPFFEALRETRPGAVVELLPIATEEPPGETFAGVRGSVNNHYGVGHLQFDYRAPLPPGYLGVLQLDGDLPVHVSLVLRGVVLATRRVDPGAGEVRFTLAPEALLARRSGLACRVVQAEDGAPIAGATLSLTAGAGMRYPLPESDAAGELRIEDQDPGTYEMVLAAEGRGTVRREVVLPPGGVLDLDAIELEPETRISGRVVDEAGAPTQACLELGSLDGAGSLAMVRATYWMAGPDGGFTIPALAPGRYVVRTVAGECAFGPAGLVATGNHVVSTLGGSVEGLELVAKPVGRLVLRYERDDWREIRFEVLVSGGLPRASGGLWRGELREVPLPHGSYRLRVSDGGGVLLDREVEIGAEPTVVDLPAQDRAG